MCGISRNKITLGLLSDTRSYANEVKNDEAIEMIETTKPKLDLNDIIQVDFPDDQYFREQTDKKQIVLHHTVSGQGVDGDISWWRQTVERIGTAIIIGWDGKIYQCFSTKYWAHHLGCKTPNNIELNKGSIGIEIDGWGALLKHNDKFYPAKWDPVEGKDVPNTKVKPIPAENVQEYPKESFPQGFMGYWYFEKYTAAQIESVRKLLVYWNGKYNIPLVYQPSMWNKSTKALGGWPGVWTHVSFRGSGKSDCHPDEKLVKMLKSLTE
jgi:N-acetyl-anhydromuramyl-L-alanine amidase AmpD